MTDELNISYLDTTKNGMKYWSVRTITREDLGVIKQDRRGKIIYLPTTNSVLNASRLHELFAFIISLK